MSEPEVDSTDRGLAKVLSERDLLVLAFGAMIGWGWIVLSGQWIDEGGPVGAISAFVVGGTLVVFVALLYGELASAMPFVGGEHVYSHRALGALGSFVCTWAIAFGYVSVVAFEAVALPSALAYVIPGFNAVELWSVAGDPVYATWVTVGVIGAVAMTAVNYVGIRPAAQFQAIVTLVIALAGVVLVVGAIVGGQPSPDPPVIVGAAGIFGVVLATPFMFVGFDVIPQAAEESDVPTRSLGTIVVVSVLLATLFYIAVIWGSSRALPGARLVESPLPAAAAMETLYDSVAIGRLMAVAGIAGILTSWNAFIIGGSRAIFAMADSGMLPAFLARTHSEYDTPSNAIVLIGASSALAPLFGEGMLGWIVNAGGLGIVLAWLFVCVSFLVLRRREPGMDRPFRVPFGYATGTIALVLSAFVVFLYLPGGPSALVWPYEWLMLLLWSLLGIALFAFSPRGRALVG